MKEEIKEILEALKPHDKEFASIKEYPLALSVKEQKILLDYITNLDEKYKELKEENERLKEIAHKMHLWIFLHSGDEQKVYDELGLTDEENTILGYSGQFILKGDKDELKEGK